MRFITIKTRVTIYFTLMMVLVVALVLIFMLIVGNSVLTNNAETTLLDVVHDNIDDVESVSYTHLENYLSTLPVLVAGAPSAMTAAPA